MNLQFKSIALAVVCSALVPLASHAQTTISDTFSLNGDDRVAGAQLAGTSPEVGTGTWQPVFTGGAVFGSSGGLVLSSSNDINGYILASSPQAVSSISLTMNYGGTATIDPTIPNGGGYGYMFLAFGEGGSPYGIGGFLDNTGNVVIFNRQIYPIGTAAIAGFSLSSTYTLTLDYNQSTQMMSASINGTQVIAPVSLVANGGTIADDGYANPPILGDFFGTNLGNTPNFTVSGYSYTAAAVPEPSTVAMLMAGGVFAMVFLRRRSSKVTA